MLFALASAAGLSACRPTAPVGFDSPEPMGRVDAALLAAERGDRTAIPDLIRLLDSDDPLIRMVAIRSLERLTGETMGYRHDAPTLERRRAADRWTEWWLSLPESEQVRYRAPEGREDPPGRSEVSGWAPSARWANLAARRGVRLDAKGVENAS